MAPGNPRVRWSTTAYNLDSCAGFQLESDCGMDDYHFVLIVTYERTCLSFAMLEVDLYTYEIHNITHFEKYGQDNGSIVSNPLSNIIAFNCSGTQC